MNVFAVLYCFTKKCTSLDEIFGYSLYRSSHFFLHEWCPSQAYETFFVVCVHSCNHRHMLGPQCTIQHDKTQYVGQTYRHIVGTYLYDIKRGPTYPYPDILPGNITMVSICQTRYSGSCLSWSYIFYKLQCLLS